MSNAPPPDVLPPRSECPVEVVCPALAADDACHRHGTHAGVAFGGGPQDPAHLLEGGQARAPAPQQRGERGELTAAQGPAELAFGVVALRVVDLAIHA